MQEPASPAASESKDEELLEDSYEANEEDVLIDESLLDRSEEGSVEVGSLNPPLNPIKEKSCKSDKADAMIYRSYPLTNLIPE